MPERRPKPLKADGGARRDLRRPPSVIYDELACRYLMLLRFLEYGSCSTAVRSLTCDLPLLLMRSLLNGGTLGRRAQSMNGELAQLVALVAHTRAALVGVPFSLDLRNSTFKYVADLSFDVQRRRLFRGVIAQPVAKTPREWYQHLASTKCRSAVLVMGPPTGNLPSHIASAFAGASHWGTVVGNEASHALWRADWTVGDRTTAIDNKIWQVRYKEFPFSAVPTGESILEASARLADVLRLADDLARDGKLDFWRSWFQSAGNKLTEDTATFEYHPDMIPPEGYSQAARQLLCAAERAWVFGGMGSWNDLGFDEQELQERYDALTPQLYEAVLKGIVAAVNQGI